MFERVAKVDAFDPHDFSVYISLYFFSFNSYVYCSTGVEVIDMFVCLFIHGQSEVHSFVNRVPRHISGMEKCVFQQKISSTVSFLLQEKFGYGLSKYVYLN